MTLVVGFSIFGIAIVVITLLIKAFSCKHAWEFVDKTDFPAPIETARKVGLEHVWMSDIPRMSKRTSVIVLRCPKCGETQILRETH